MEIKTQCQSCGMPLANAVKAGQGKSLTTIILEVEFCSQCGDDIYQDAHKQGIEDGKGGP